MFALEADILTVSCKNDVTDYTFDDFQDNDYQSCLWLSNDSFKCTCKYCVDGSICHVKFPKVVLAHISSAMGTFTKFCSVFIPVHVYQSLLKSVYIRQTQSTK